MSGPLLSCFSCRKSILAKSLVGNVYCRSGLLMYSAHRYQPQRLRLISKSCTPGLLSSH